MHFLLSRLIPAFPHLFLHSLTPFSPPILISLHILLFFFPLSSSSSPAPLPPPHVPFLLSLYPIFPFFSPPPCFVLCCPLFPFSSLLSLSFLPPHPVTEESEGMMDKLVQDGSSRVEAQVGAMKPGVGLGGARALPELI